MSFPLRIRSGLSTAGESGKNGSAAELFYGIHQQFFRRMLMVRVEAQLRPGASTRTKIVE